MRLGKQRAADMTEGSIWKHLLQFAVPMLAGLLFALLGAVLYAVLYIRARKNKKTEAPRTPQE